jgi:hypothetical protein
VSTRFKSKVDAWLAVVLVAGALVSAGASLIVLSTSSPYRWLLVPVMLLVGTGLPVSLLLRTDYTLENDVLLVRSGLFRWRVPLRDIVAINPTRNPMSSPALSLDRLLITRRNGLECMVSPRDKEGFLRELRNHGVTMVEATPSRK